MLYYCMQAEKLREKAMVRYSNRESKLLKAKEMDEASTSASVGQGDTETQSHEVTQEGTTQVSIQEFLVKKVKDTITSERVVEPCGSKDTELAMTVQDQIMKAETLWALKTASENFSFRVSDGVPELFQKMFPDSTIAKHMTMSRTKVRYTISHGLDPTFTSRQLKIFREYLTLITLYTLMKPQMLKVRSKWIFL